MAKRRFNPAYDQKPDDYIKRTGGIVSTHGAIQSGRFATSGTPPLMRQASAQENAAEAMQQYQDAQVMRAAQMPGGATQTGAGTPAQTGFKGGGSLLAGGQQFPDAAMYYNPDLFQDQPSVMAAYKEEVRQGASKMYMAMARMPTKFENAKQAEDWLTSQPFYKPELGAALHAEMETHLNRASPDVLNRIREENKQTETRRSLERRAEEAGPEFAVGIGPAGEWKLMPKELTPIEEAQQLKKTVQATVDQSNGQLQMRWRLGQPEAISVEELTKERTEDIDKQIVVKEKIIDSTKDIITMDGDESGVLGLRITRYNKEIGALLLERDGLEAGATPAAQAPTAGAAQPIPSQDKIGEITAGLQRTDLTIQEREYLQQKLQQLQQEQPQGAPAPAGGKGSITMGGKTVTRAGVAPKPGTGSITRAGETATNVPAVKPVAPAAPYVAPITKVQDVLAREPAMPKSLPSKEPTAPPSRQEIEREVAEREYSELDFDNFVNRKIKEAGMTVSDWANAAIQGLYGLGDLANQGALLVGKGTIAATQAPRYTIETAQKMTTAAKNKLSITIENMMRAEEVNNRLAKLTKEAGK